MLRFVMTAADGQSVTLGGVLSARLEMGLDVPADSLTVTIPFDRRLRTGFDRLSAYDGDDLVFTGQPDETDYRRESGKSVLRVTARSLAALLLDNEAEPLTYSNPSARMMMNRHLTPFGIDCEDDERHPLYDTLQITKGMSHWQVLERYCRRRYGAAPRIFGTRAYLKGFAPDGEVVFGDGGVGYVALRELRRPCKVISEVRVMIDEAQGYGARVVNHDESADGVTRVRYVNALNRTRSLDTAEQMIANGNRAARQMKLRCPGAHVILPGTAAVVRDRELGELRGLSVGGLQYVLGENGEYTDVTLVRTDNGKEI